MTRHGRLLTTAGAVPALNGWGAGDLACLLDTDRLQGGMRPGVMEPVLMTPEESQAVGPLPEGAMPVLVSSLPWGGAVPSGLHLASAGPMDRAILDELASRPPGRLRPTPPELEATCLGLVIPMILHNLGNRLVGLVGNLELAAIYPAGSEKSVEKIRDGKTAAGEVRGYLEELAAMRSPGQALPGARQTPCSAALGLASMIHGRAVTIEASRDCSRPGAGDFPPGAVSAGIALVTVALLRLRGSGRLALSGGTPPGLRISWERPDTDAPCLPGMALVPSLIAGASAIAFREGFRLVINAMGDLGGSAACLWDG